MNITEDQEQIALVQRAQYNPITRDFLMSYPIEGLRHPVTAMRLKKKGARAGIPDLFLAYPIDNYHGLWVELKHAPPRKGTLTGDQVIWIERLKGVGYKAEVAYGATDAWAKIMDYLHIDDKNI